MFLWEDTESIPDSTKTTDEKCPLQKMTEYSEVAPRVQPSRLELRTRNFPAYYSQAFKRFPFSNSGEQPRPQAVRAGPWEGPGHGALLGTSSAPSPVTRPVSTQSFHLSTLEKGLSLSQPLRVWSPGFWEPGAALGPAGPFWEHADVQHLLSTKHCIKELYQWHMLFTNTRR